MKIALSILAVLVFAAPIIVWIGLSSAMCGHSAHAGCSVGLGDFIDEEFMMIAVLPWLLAMALGLLAWRVGQNR